MDGIIGLQFENLILANRALILKILKIEPSQLITAAPYYQTKNSKTKGACQVDLLIHTNLDVFYLCEIKFKKRIGLEIIKETKKKIALLKLPKRAALKPVLIFEGEIDPNALSEVESYFFKLISFHDLLSI